MTDAATAATVDLAFPIGCAHIGEDRVVIRLDRDSLPTLRAYLAALELQLSEARVVGLGQG